MAPPAAAALRDLAVAQVDATATLVRAQTAEIDPDDAAAHAMLNDARAQIEVAQAALQALAEALPAAGEDEAAWRDRLRHEVLDVWIKVRPIARRRGRLGMRTRPPLSTAPARAWAGSGRRTWT